MNNLINSNTWFSLHHFMIKRRAYRDHRCTECHSIIKKGESYYRYTEPRGRGRSVYTLKICEACSQSSKCSIDGAASLSKSNLDELWTDKEKLELSTKAIRAASGSTFENNCRCMQCAVCERCFLYKEYH